VVAQEIRDIKRKLNTFHQDNRRDVLKLSQELMGPVHGRFNCIKVLIYLKYFDLRRELQSSLLIQRHLGKCFPTFSQSSRYLEADTA
jgi:hypothetical protein